ncbi:early nodulin-like protein 1 [Macadamia integrifolia]|uniref:early nodulin-like protein 1 n=1 Tax=Macadamia integrifolia TaxID=60698 RepID=UPI001C4F82BB|nr:early nodulin-like protein 1 [Macadamia integrifolia]
MATPLLGSAKAVPIILTMIIFISSLQQFTVSSFEFEVGGSNGWVVPPLNATKIYSEWASRNRFRVDDSIRFKYKKDSVMVVSGSDYNQCDSTHPMFFSNDGNTVYHFDHSGSFYFISGVLSHCKRGQKVIVKVMSPEDDSPSSGGRSSHVIPTSGLSALLLLQFLLSFFGFHLP